MRKLIVINLILAFLLLSVFILGYYFFEYPNDFNIGKYIRDAEWKPFVLIVMGMAIVAFVLSFLPIKKYNQKWKTAIALAVLQGLSLSLLLFKVVVTYREHKQEYDNLVSEYKQKADADIKAGFIVIEYAGGLELLDEREQKMRAEIDSVRRKYGLSYRNSGCIVSAAIMKAQEEYERLTKPYLNKRNGPRWEDEMNEQVKVIQNHYR